MQNKTGEHWLNGPIDGVPALLQPAAHALMQAKDEIHAALEAFDQQALWKRPAGVAAVAFHLQHIPGVLDRLRTYSSSLPLSSSQLKYLSEEGLETDSIRLADLLAHLDAGIQEFITFMKNVDPAILTERRNVGRKQLPSTVIGLIFHAAEHTMRHTGQLLVTSRVIAGSEARDHD